MGISPNQVTIGRLVFFVPGWFLWVYMKELGDFLGIWWQAVGLFALILVTIVILLDIVDGALARETGQVTQSGKVLDPAIDKFITYTTLILFWPAIDHTALVVLFILDIVSTFLRGAKNQGANQFGKIKALSQNISKLFFGIAVLANIPQFNVIGNLFIWLALLMAIISVGIRTIPTKKNHL
ncbi:MAG: CDP-alcohol phosphatidyltransferase family protein [Gammaproteobacteria bacterium]|nr:CDP-alcohol phosphatidyltransferase family protein [Gammaproteobacteria bacterium]